MLTQNGLTPSQQRCQTPRQRVKPHQDDCQRGSALGVPVDGLQRLSDHYVAVDGDSQQVDHGGDPEQGATECIHLTAQRQTKRPLQRHATCEHACVIREKCAGAVVTHFSEHPLLVETVDEEDGRLGEGHEEVTDGQVYDEVVWQAPQLLITS